MTVKVSTDVHGSGDRKHYGLVHDAAAALTAMSTATCSSTAMSTGSAQRRGSGQPSTVSRNVDVPRGTTGVSLLNNRLAPVNLTGRKRRGGTRATGDVAPHERHRVTRANSSEPSVRACRCVAAVCTERTLGFPPPAESPCFEETRRAKPASRDNIEGRGWPASDIDQ